MQYLHLDGMYLERTMGSKNFTQQMLMFSAITGALDNHVINTAKARWECQLLRAEVYSPE